MAISPGNIASIRSGSLRHQVTIQQLAPAANSRGDPGNAYNTFATIRCKVTPLTGRQLEAAQQILAEASLMVETRYHAGIVAGMRVAYGSRYFTIGAVIDVNELHREMQLLCTERVGEQ